MIKIDVNKKRISERYRLAMSENVGVWKFQPPPSYFRNSRLESCGTELFYKVLQNGKWIHILIFLNKKTPLSCFLAFSKLVLVWYKPTHIIIFTRFCNDLWALEFWISNIKTQYKNYLFVLVFTLQLHRIFRCSSSNSIAMYFLSFFFLLFFFFI